MGAKRILVVDDSATIRETLAMTLQFRQCEVTEAASAEEALELLRRREFDLAFCDLAMPGIGGRALIARARGKLGLRDLPLIVLSAEEREQKDDALSAGANDCLDKPFTPNEIFAVLDRYLPD